MRGNGFFGFEIRVAGRELEHALERHAGMLGYDLRGYVANAHQIVSARLHRKGASAHACAADERVVDHDAAVRQHVSRVAGDEQQRGHAGGKPQAHGAYGAADGAHHVVERQPRLHLAAGAVDEQRDGCGGVGFLQVA